MEPPTEAQGSASADPPDQGQEAGEEAVQVPESEETAPAEVPASQAEGGGNVFTQESGTPTPEGSSQTQGGDEPAQEDSGVADGAQDQMTDPSDGTDARNQAGQRQPAESQETQPGNNPGEETAVPAERETAVLLAASLICLLIGLAAVFLYPRKH